MTLAAPMHLLVNLKRGSHGRGDIAKEKQCHAVARRSNQKATLAFRLLNLGRRIDEIFHLDLRGGLLISPQHGVADDVQIQDVRNFHRATARGVGAEGSAAPRRGGGSLLTPLGSGAQFGRS